VIGGTNGEWRAVGGMLLAALDRDDTGMAAAMLGEDRERLCVILARISAYLLECSGRGSLRTAESYVTSMLAEVDRRERAG